MPNSIIIDVASKDVKKLVHRLNKLRSTVAAHDWGAYNAIPMYSQVHVETTKTVEEVEDWLYKFGGFCDWIGAVSHDNIPTCTFTA